MPPPQKVRPMVDNPFIRPYFPGGVALGGGPLNSHDFVEGIIIYIIH